MTSEAANTDRLVGEIAERVAVGLHLDDLPGRLKRLPPPPPPASPHLIERAESLVTARLPTVLRRLYLEVANGGFGPGYGVLGLDGGFADDLGQTAVDILSERDDGSWPGLPSGLLPLCHWGCAIYSFVGCPSGRMYGWDPNPVEPGDDVPFFEQEYTIDAWLSAWLDGSLLQPLLLVDPATGSYRGATIAGTRAAIDEV